MTSQSSLFDSFEKLNALDELFEASAAYRSSENFLKLMQFIRRFPSLSPFNAFLIHMQNPGVVLVMTARKWKKLGRKVKPNARPMVILIPFGPVDFVYDISDTEGEEVPRLVLNPFHTDGRLQISIYDRTVWNCATDRIKYEELTMGVGSAGYATQREKDFFKVVVNKTYNLESKYSTLVHELAHVYGGHLGTFQKSWWKPRTGLITDVEEIEAESISYLVCGRNGLITSSDAYLSDYIKTKQEIPLISMDVILTVSGYIESLGKPGFKPKKKK
jgi:hypothetical protein